MWGSPVAMEAASATQSPFWTRSDELQRLEVSTATGISCVGLPAVLLPLRSDINTPWLQPLVL